MVNMMKSIGIQQDNFERIMDDVYELEKRIAMVKRRLEYDLRH